MIERNGFSNHIKLSSVPFYIGIVCIIFFSACAFFSWRAEAGYVTFIFLGFIFLGIFSMFFGGDIAFDEKSIYYRFMFSSYKMDWAEISLVETDDAGNAIVFAGEDKHIAIMGPGHWEGKSRDEFMEKLLEKIKRQNLEIHVTAKAGLRGTGKNTKIK